MRDKHKFRLSDCRYRSE